MIVKTLSDVIAQIESSNCQFALRFESGMFNSLNTPSPAGMAIIKTIQNIHNCNMTSAKMIYCTSFGKWQSMGFNVYDPAFGYTKPISQYMDNALDQLAQFNWFVNNKGINFTTDQLAASQTTRITFAQKYNGAASYADLIKVQLINAGYKVQ